ncbi:restriction endonuclease subunit S [Acinetobacter modestus]|uniref:restriction endonuclease subunit S n=1 Tax=Acinetobacter modestus TaxID=1776740 RepID=UPI001F4B795F|nr:restriction endonuclease subunit S [Acinetobacter modestus]MCH7334664.1 restriction endonuclease subunit S [Acinetobacter modestus]
MMYQKYDAYKDSGVQWLGDIPNDWEVVRFRDICNFSKGLNITKENLQDTGIPCVNYGEVHSKYGFEVSPERNELKCVSEDYLKNSPKSLLAYGDFIFADTSEDIDGSGNFTYLNSHNLTFAGYHTVIVRPKPYINVRYLAYVFDSLSFRHQVRTAVKGVKVYSITKAILKDTAVWLPNVDRQYEIAQFLDQKTTQIDQAIAIKEQQIALLNERKQIVIQQAVTKGLDPNVKMKDSGVEWIGEIPEHWEIFANRAIFSERNESGRDGLPLLSVSIHTGVSDEEMDEDTNVQGRVKIEDKSKYILVKKGDIAFNMMRAWQGAIGAVSVDGMVSPAYIVAKPTKRIDANFFEYQYRCPEFIQQMGRYSKGITDFRKRLYWDGFKQLSTLVPPISEQLKIIEFIKALNNQIETVVSVKTQQIQKLKEYKTTLINDAVTGKIKVA